MPRYIYNTNMPAHSYRCTPAEKSCLLIANLGAITMVIACAGRLAARDYNFLECVQLILNPYSAVCSTHTRLAADTFELWPCSFSFFQLWRAVLLRINEWYSSLCADSSGSSHKTVEAQCDPCLAWPQWTPSDSRWSREGGKWYWVGLTKVGSRERTVYMHMHR